MKIILLVGARPNFIKIAPIIRAIDKYNNSAGGKALKSVLVHSGQHYDYEMSKVFFEDLDLPEPDIHLGVGSGTHAEQTARVMTKFEEVLFREKPDLVIVVGDVNSTLAGAITAAKMHIPIGHVEAGLRSRGQNTPEEINRLLTDTISDYLFTPLASADENLIREGIPENKIFLVGNVMVDSLFYHRQRAEQSRVLSKLGLRQGDYAILTLHRPANVDNRERLKRISEAIREVSRRIPIVFPAHPRTKRNIEKFGLNALIEDEHIQIIKPLGYLDFLKLMMNARFVMTDSGGIEPETTVLGIPCLTMLDSTAWVETVNQGTNTLVGDENQKITTEAFKILDGQEKKGSVPELWDGKTAERIVNILAGL